MQALSMLTALARRTPTVPATPRARGQSAPGVPLQATIPEDGCVDLQWSAPAGFSPSSWWLLAVRTGARPGYTGLRLDADTRVWRFTRLGRHQRYRFMVLGVGADGRAASPWIAATPRAGLGCTVEADTRGTRGVLADLTRVLVMPQDRRLTVYWQLSRGFAERVVVALGREGHALATWEMEPEVTGFVVDTGRFPALENGTTYTVTVSTRFAQEDAPGVVVTCTPAPQGRERDLNRAHPQQGLVYACLALGAELDVFGESAGAAAADTPVACGLCGKPTAWKDNALRCTGCRAEFIANGRGDFLDVTRLRFGTCACCLPRRILVQDAGSTSLRCAMSGKEYVRLTGNGGHVPIEDLPYGLCQCCRPRRPLLKGADATVRCTRSNEVHRRASGDSTTWVLVPSAPVFDAAAIDELLDAGLADICQGGVSRGRR